MSLERRWWSCIVLNVRMCTPLNPPVIITQTGLTLEQDFLICCLWSTQNTDLNVQPINLWQGKYLLIQSLHNYSSTVFCKAMLENTVHKIQSVMLTWWCPGSAFCKVGITVNLVRFLDQSLSSLNNFCFSRTVGPMLNQTGTKYLWVNRDSLFFQWLATSLKGR